MQSGLLQREPLPGRSASQHSSSTPSVASRIAAHAVASPTKPAIVDGNLSVTFADLETRSNQLANYLWEAGAGPESCIAILMERSAQFVVAALAVLKTGAAYLPLDPSTPLDRTAFILADAGAKLLLTHRRKSRDLNPGQCRVIELDDADASRIAARPTTHAPVQPDPSSLAYVIYTSGSTGRPKGVEITHANLFNLIDWHQAAFAVTPADRASQVAGLGFDAAVWEIWPHLTAGASLHFADEITRRSPSALRDWLVAEKITISFVPTVLAEQLLHVGLARRNAAANIAHRRRHAASPPGRGISVRAGEQLRPDRMHGRRHIRNRRSRFRRHRPALHRPADRQRHYPHPRRQPAPRALLASPANCALPAHLVGRGYRNNPELTAERFVNLPRRIHPRPVRIYRTGDRACLLANGEIAFLGRLDDQVKIRGYRIELGEIVARLDRAPASRPAPSSPSSRLPVRPDLGCLRRRRPQRSIECFGSARVPRRPTPRLHDPIPFRDPGRTADHPQRQARQIGAPAPTAATLPSRTAPAAPAAN